MVDPEARYGPGQFDASPTAQSHFSWIRTRLSIERTLLSWVRTAVALFGFGFTIVKFFDYLHTASGLKPAILPGAPRLFGLALIAASVMVLAISIWQYHRSINYLRSAPFDRIATGPEIKMNTPALSVCVGLLVIGLAAFVALVTRTI